MASVADHYEKVLSDLYAWMYGGFDTALAQNEDFFRRHGIIPGKGLAVDLGAGCGFQSIPLARAGYRVIALDLDETLLDELKAHDDTARIESVVGDLLTFHPFVDAEIDVAVCMTDTILHLPTPNDVQTLFHSVRAALSEAGQFVVTFRDLTHELKDEERFLPVRSDDENIFTCFLEYEPDTVKVHDIIYRKQHGTWQLSKSFYRKLRLSRTWVETELAAAGFTSVRTETENGMLCLFASA